MKFLILDHCRGYEEQQPIQQQQPSRPRPVYPNPSPKRTIDTKRKAVSTRYQQIPFRIKPNTSACPNPTMTVSKYRGFSPYATFGTFEKFALAKNRISQILVIVLKNRRNEFRIRRELPVFCELTYRQVLRAGSCVSSPFSNARQFQTRVREVKSIFYQL